MALTSSWRPLRGTTAQWKARASFIPEDGQPIVYTDHHYETNEKGEEVPVPAFKLGDGKAYVVDLPFMNSGAGADIEEELRRHVNNTEIHVSRSDRTKWDGKVNSSIFGEILLLTNDIN